MFGLSGLEIAVIVLFGFLIFGPDKLPEIARTVGRALRQFRSAQEQMNEVIKAEVYDPLKDLEPLANPFAGFSLDETKKDATKDATKKVTSGTAKPDAKKADDKAASKAVGDKSSATTAATAATGATAASAAATTDAVGAGDKSLPGKAEADAPEAAEKPKISSDAMKAAVSEQAAKARDKAVQETTKKTADAATTTESFAQRRARLEREHAKAKAEKAATPATPAAATPAAAPATPTAATTAAPAATPAPDDRKEGEPGN